MLQARPGPVHRGESVAVVDARWPHRRGLVIGETLVTVAGLGGSVMLLADWNTPPLEAIAPLGLTSWTLPGLWLAATVPVPAAAAVVLAWRRSPRAPGMTIVANATMAFEVLVQIPFLGRSPLQAVVGGTAGGLTLLARHARRSGWGTVAADRNPGPWGAPEGSGTVTATDGAQGVSLALRRVHHGSGRRFAVRAPRGPRGTARQARRRPCRRSRRRTP